MENWHLTLGGLIFVAAVVGAVERIYRLVFKPLFDSKGETEKFRREQRMRNAAYDRALPDPEAAELKENISCLD